MRRVSSGHRSATCERTGGSPSVVTPGAWNHGRRENRAWADEVVKYLVAQWTIMANYVPCLFRKRALASRAVGSAGFGKIGCAGYHCRSGTRWPVMAGARLGNTGGTANRWH